MSGFNWDDQNINHIARHGVTPEEIEEVFNGDPEYVCSFTKDGEERYRAFGVTAGGRYLTVGYVERNELMTRRERKIYDTKKIDHQK